MRTASAITSSLFAIVVFSATASLDARADCNPRDFMIQDFQYVQSSGELEIAFALTMTQEEYDRAKKSGSAGGTYGIISGSASYGEAQEKARRLAEATKFDYKSSYASLYVAQTLSPKAMEAYTACLEKDKEKPGLVLWLKERQGDYFTFKAFWVGADTTVAVGTYDSEPFVDGGEVVGKPDAWVKSTTEEIVVKRQANTDLFLNLKVGGKTKSIVVVKDPPLVTWRKELRNSPKVMKASSWGPNPGCTPGEDTDYLVPIHPGGMLIEGSGVVVERTTTDPTSYKETFDVNTADRISVKITQATGACESHKTATGRLSAYEQYPVAAE